MNSNTYAARAGRYTGLAYRQLVWALTQIDWREVGRIVGHGLIALVVLTYVAGEMTGHWVHATNDRLARLWVVVLVPEKGSTGKPADPDHFVEVPKMVPQLLLPPAPAPVALLAPARPTEPPAVHIDAVAMLAAGGLSQRAIAQHMKAAGFSQRAIADSCKVSRRTVGRWLHAKHH